MPLTSSVVEQMTARFHSFYNLKSQDLVEEGAVSFKQVHRFIKGNKIFWG